MKKLIAILFSSLLISAQSYYTYSPNMYFILTKTTTLAAAAEKITIQMPAQNSPKVRLIAGYVSCSVACIVTLSNQGTAATGTTLIQRQLNPTTGARSSVVNCFSSSNAGAGTTLATYPIPATGDKVFDLSSIQIQGDGTGNNFSIGTNSISGDVTINLMWVEM